MKLKDKGIWDRFKHAERVAEVTAFGKTGSVDKKCILDAFKKILIYETERNDDLSRIMAEEVSEQIFD